MIILQRDKIQFIKFLFVGCLNTAFGYLMYSLFLFIGFHYALASLLGTILGIFFNFKTTGGLVFKNKNNFLIFKFFAVYSIVYTVNVTSLKIFDYFNINLYLAGFILLFPLALLSFILMKRFVFGEKNAQ